MKIEKTVLIDTSKRELSDFFANLADNYQQYRMAGHRGIFPIQGKINQVGSIFETRERFAMVFIKLRFTTTQVDENSGFSYRLIKPLSRLNLYNTFFYRVISKEKLELILKIYCVQPQGFWAKILSKLIFLPPFSIMIRLQIDKEMNFIKTRVEGSGN